MKKLALFILPALLVISLARPCMAQDAMPAEDQGQSAATSADDQGQSAEMPGEDMNNSADEPGTYCCECPDCMAGRMCNMCGKMCMMGGMGGKMGMKDGMGMMGRMRMMDGMRGMRGDIDRMTWPPMNRSCRTPDFYLDRADGLELSDEQVASLDRLSAALRKEQILKGAAVKALELDLSTIVTKTDFKLDEAMKKLKEIEDARFELRSRVLKYSSDARDVLSPEQLDKVKGLGVGRRNLRGRAMPGMMEDKNPGGMKQRMMEKMRREMMNQ